MQYQGITLIPKSCFKSVICRQNLPEKATDLHVFPSVVGRKPSSQESSEDSVLIDPPGILRPPKH